MDYLPLIANSLNTIGAIFLAFALNGAIGSLNSSIKALELFKHTLLSGGDIYSFQGLDRQRERSFEKAKNLTYIGLMFLFVGFLVQMIGFFGFKITFGTEAVARLT